VKTRIRNVPEICKVEVARTTQESTEMERSQPNSDQSLQQNAGIATVGDGTRKRVPGLNSLKGTFVIN